MSTIKVDQKRLDNIAKAYHKTGGEVREMWKNKWSSHFASLERTNVLTLLGIKIVKLFYYISPRELPVSIHQQLASKGTLRIHLHIAVDTRKRSNETIQPH